MFLIEHLFSFYFKLPKTEVIILIVVFAVGKVVKGRVIFSKILDGADKHV